MFVVNVFYTLNEAESYKEAMKQAGIYRQIKVYRTDDGFAVSGIMISRKNKLRKLNTMFG